ncbi:sensor histidine kinase [Weizmannia acidilactici]|uniref:histidine kinase n=1 Tax=Weizmannia acidilactici TaxID=2607726 RepID=A0A5J4JLZ5_9BACI|nr:sensor histidine kinase [Weizmannia acidilactici]GER71660.1 sensor histidine kinase [Weizmannia acidilactici]GER73983.1 sensor histidine kinase [Weizmannia acidilactici]
MAALLPIMLERAGILVIAAFLLSRLKTFRQIIHQEYGRKEKLVLILIFGIFGMISNYTGIVIEHGKISEAFGHSHLSVESAIANTRIMGVGIAGLMGGPVVGIGAGVFAGIHRLTLGGYTNIACSLSTIIAGIFMGLLGKRYNVRGKYAALQAVCAGMLMEMLQMAIILSVAKPYEDALELVRLIAVPMITINGFGTFVFILIIQTILLEEERTRAWQTHRALQIAQETLAHFRKGLNTESCKKAAEIILKRTSADAVAITDREKVLAHVGAASDHHIPLQSMSTKLTEKVLEQGKIMVATSNREIQCTHEGCPLQAAIVLPLLVREQVVGTLKLYFKTAGQLSSVEQELAEGLSKLFSNQLELAEAELQRKLLKDAEIKALQAQVHPHFFFNAINTITCLVRTDTDKARALLIQLAAFFRSNLQGSRKMLIPLEKELEHVKAYLAIEQARFPGRYDVVFDIDPFLKTAMVPPFTLQPLVENAIHHAFSRPGAQKPSVAIRAFVKNGNFYMVTEDNGKGIPEELARSLGNVAVDSSDGTGTALWNIKKRMEEIYGRGAMFHIESRENAGTKVTISIPLDEMWGEEYAKSICS